MIEYIYDHFLIIRDSVSSIDLPEKIPITKPVFNIYNLSMKL